MQDRPAKQSEGGRMRVRQYTAPGLGKLEVYRGRILSGKVDDFGVARRIWNEETMYQ